MGCRGTLLAFAATTDPRGARNTALALRAMLSLPTSTIAVGTIWTSWRAAKLCSYLQWRIQVKMLPGKRSSVSFGDESGICFVQQLEDQA